MITPESVAKEDEASHQLALFMQLRIEARTRPKFALAYHIPNGGSRGDTARSRAIEGGKMKGEGVKAGVPDVHWPIARGGFHSLYIEMKRPSVKPKSDKSPRGTSLEQDLWIEALTAEGHCVAVCYSWTEAMEVFNWYYAQ